MLSSVPFQSFRNLQGFDALLKKQKTNISYNFWWEHRDTLPAGWLFQGLIFLLIHLERTITHHDSTSDELPSCTWVLAKHWREHCVFPALRAPQTLSFFFFFFSHLALPPSALLNKTGDANAGVELLTGTTGVQPVPKHPWWAGWWMAYHC